ncbi:MAG: nucleotidyltransferase domain-containing protein [Candidatus Rokubacteria bacterium]|nr:nucleotidyltransferase domain-containing protein [Candidatus Rokubacteria bacterium]
MEKTKAAPRAEELVRRTIEHLCLKVRVDQAILFGSYARGEAHQWSDVDLAVISPDFVRMRHAKLVDLLVEVSLAVDPSVEVRPYTPRDLKEARPTNFRGHILAEGKVVYRGGKFLL